MRKGIRKTNARPTKKAKHAKKIFVRKWHIFLSQVLFVIMTVVIIALVPALVGAYRVYKSQTKSVVETPQSQIGIIPMSVQGILGTSTSSAAFKVPVLRYQYVDERKKLTDKNKLAFDTEPATLEAQIKTLKEAKYTFMTAKDLGDVLDGNKKLPKNPVLLTFDNGYTDFYTNVLPLLKKYNVKATLYVPSGQIGFSDHMTDKQMKAVVNSKLVELGAYTVHHTSLQGKLEIVAQKEIQDSKKMLQDKYNVPVYSFAYPNGAFDQQDITIISKYGYSTAMSAIPGTELSEQNRYFIYRITAGTKAGDDLLSYINGDNFVAKK